MGSNDTGQEFFKDLLITLFDFSVHPELSLSDTRYSKTEILN